MFGIAPRALRVSLDRVLQAADCRLGAICDKRGGIDGVLLLSSVPEFWTKESHLAGLQKADYPIRTTER